MSDALDQSAAALDGGAAEVELDRTMRNQLNQLHGDANRLLATRIDAILVGELTSAKDEARTKRKGLTQLSEKLIERLEALVRRFDEIREQIHGDRPAATSSSEGEDADEETVPVEGTPSDGKDEDIAMV